MAYIGEQHIPVIGATWTPATAEKLEQEIRKVNPLPIKDGDQHQLPHRPCGR